MVFTPGRSVLKVLRPGSCSVLAESVKATAVPKIYPNLAKLPSPRQSRRERFYGVVPKVAQLDGLRTLAVNVLMRDSETDVNMYVTCHIMLYYIYIY